MHQVREFLQVNDFTKDDEIKPEDTEWLKLRGFNFQKLLIDNFHLYADTAAKHYAEENSQRISVKNAFADGFRECTRAMSNSFQDCHPQAEINIYIDELIKKLEAIKQ